MTVRFSRQTSPFPRFPKAFAAGVVLATALLFTSTVPSNEAQAQSRELQELYTQLPRLYADRDFDEAIKVAERALELAEDEFGDDHVATAALMNNLGVFHKEVGNLDKAEDLYDEALDIRRDRLGDNHIDVAQSLNNLGVLKQATGDLEEAEELFREALAIREENLDPYHPDVAQTLNNLAVVYTGLDEFDEAEPLFEEALDLLSASASADTSVVEATLGNFADMYQRQGNAEAEAEVRAELAMLRGETAPTGVVLKQVDPESETARAAQPQIAAASAPVPVPGADAVPPVETESTAETAAQSGDGPPRDIFLPVETPAAPATAEATPAASSADPSGGATATALAEQAVAEQDAAQQVAAAAPAADESAGASTPATATAPATTAPEQQSIFENTVDPLEDALRKVEQANASLEAMKRRQMGLEEDAGESAAASPSGPTAQIATEQAATEPTSTEQAAPAQAAPAGTASASDEPRQQVAAAPTETPAAAAPAPRPYAIQVGVRKDRARADALREEVIAKGYPADVFETTNKRGEAIFSVRFGRYGSLDAANLAQRSYKTNTGKEGLIIQVDTDSDS